MKQYTMEKMNTDRSGLFEKVSTMLNFVNRGRWRDCKARRGKGFFCRLQCAGDPEVLTCGEVLC